MFCSESGYFLNEKAHFTLADDPVAIRVSVSVALFEIVVGELAICNAKTFHDVTHKDSGLWLFENSGVIVIVLIPNLVDTLSEYFVNILPLLLEGHQIYPSFLLPGDAITEEVFGFRQFVHVSVPENAELGVLLVVEELLLPTLIAKDLLQLQS